jgi:hypothetical protein
MRCRYSTVFEPFASPFTMKGFVWVGKGVICTVTEALKGGPAPAALAEAVGLWAAGKWSCLFKHSGSSNSHHPYHTVHVEPVLYGTKAVFLVRTKPLYWSYNTNTDKERIKDNFFDFWCRGRPWDAASRFGYLFQLQEAATRENLRLEDWPLMSMSYNRQGKRLSHN